MSCNNNFIPPSEVPCCEAIRNPNEPVKLLMDETGRVEAYDKWGNFLFSGKGKVEKDGTITVEHEQT